MRNSTVDLPTAKEAAVNLMDHTAIILILHHWMLPISEIAQFCSVDMGCYGRHCKMNDSTLQGWWVVRKAERLVTSRLGGKDKSPLVMHIAFRNCKVHDVPT
jgi:hypothetical protein